VPEKIECPCLIDVWEEIGVDAGFPSIDDQAEFHAATIHKYGEIWFFYPPSGAAPSKYLAYCVNESAAAQKHVWFRGSMAAGAVIDDPLLTDALNMNDSTVVRIAYANASTLTAIDKIGGSPTYPAYSIQSSFHYLDEGERQVQIQRYVSDSHGDTGDYRLTVFTRSWPEGSEESDSAITITPGSTLKSDFRASGRLVAVKFHSAATPGRFRLGKPVFEVVALGKR
jgi:hypothetical protein